MLPEPSRSNDRKHDCQSVTYFHKAPKSSKDTVPLFCLSNIPIIKRTVSGLNGVQVPLESAICSSSDDMNPLLSLSTLHSIMTLRYYWYFRMSNLLVDNYFDIHLPLKYVPQELSGRHWWREVCHFDRKYTPQLKLIVYNFQSQLYYKLWLTDNALLFIYGPIKLILNRAHTQHEHGWELTSQI